MPITSSAKKALKSSLKKRVMNQKRKVAVRETAKKVMAGGSQEDLSLAYKAIDKAAKRGVIKKNTAARKKARLSRAGKAKKA